MKSKKHQILDERTIVRMLAKALSRRNANIHPDDEKHLGKILTHKNPAKVQKICTVLQEMYGGLRPRLQPEIDVILRKGNDIRAIEVKVFHLRSGTSLNQSYYRGIDQALALLMYGFDKVALWHVFDQDIKPNQFITSGSNAQLFIRNQLNLPIDYTALYLLRSRSQFEFIPTQPRVKDFDTLDLLDARLLKTIPDPSLSFVWQTSNPLLKYPRVRNIRAALVDWLDDRIAN